MMNFLTKSLCLRPEVDALTLWPNAIATDIRMHTLTGGALMLHHQAFTPERCSDAEIMFGNKWPRQILSLSDRPGISLVPHLRSIIRVLLDIDRATLLDLNNF